MEKAREDRRGDYPRVREQAREENSEKALGAKEAVKMIMSDKHKVIEIMSRVSQEKRGEVMSHLRTKKAYNAAEYAKSEKKYRAKMKSKKSEV